MSMHTPLQWCTCQFSWLGLTLAIYGKAIFSLIANYSVIKMGFKIMIGEMVFHIGIHVLKAFYFWVY